MATAKKTTKKKSATTAKPRRTTASASRTTKSTRKAPAKRPTVRKKTAASSPQFQSFKLERDSRDFYSWKPDIQTLYWVILAVPVIGLTLWVANINYQVQEIYMQIDYDTQTSGISEQKLRQFDLKKSQD